MEEVPRVGEEAGHLLHGTHLLEGVEVDVELDVVNECVQGPQVVDQAQVDTHIVLQALKKSK